jgi:hypothetical protein
MPEEREVVRIASEFGGGLAGEPKRADDRLGLASMDLADLQLARALGEDRPGRHDHDGTGCSDLPGEPVEFGSFTAGPVQHDDNRRSVGVGGSVDVGRGDVRDRLVAQHLDAGNR